MKATRRTFLRAVAGGAVGTALPLDPTRLPAAPAEEFISAWPKDAERVWVGPEYWANRLQDWRLHAGRLECVQGGAAAPVRTVHLLTRRLGPGDGDLKLAVRTGLIDAGAAVTADAASGFLIGAGGATLDYRAAALVHHTPGPGGGLFAGIDTTGRVFFRDFEAPREWAPAKDRPAAPAGLPADVTLRLTATAAGDTYTLVLAALDNQTGRTLGEATRQGVEPRRLVGNLALVSHPGSGDPTARFWYRDWRVSGTKVEGHADRLCGPILCTQYTVHHGTLKLTAQLLPVGANDAQTAELQVRQGPDWKTVATTKVIVPGHTAPFRVPNWDSGQDVPYRVVYPLKAADGQVQPYTWSGTVKRDPADKETVVLAALSCVQQVNGSVDRGASYGWTNSVWFPHPDMVPNVARHRPDLLFFAGDQIYEGNPTRVIRQPAAASVLDYLYKWYLWCWSYRDLTRDTPCICIPDDHDVYHGNIWGMGGKPAREGDPSGLFGGYGMPPDWLNMMQRTQCSHLPDPYDPTPVEQGISVYYTSLVLGGIGFAILEDRKFKSSPALVQAAMTRDSHITEKGYDTRQADVPGAALLGERQEKFLRAFAQDWRGQVLKAALSQTIFCNLQISSRGETAGQLDKDLDSNGWPQSGRNRALRELRRGFMIHIAGDQHLASVVHHGVDDFEDAAWSLCVPAVANLYIRYWNPDYPPLNDRPGMPPYTGRYEDGFHNKLTVFAVANPVDKPRPGQFPEPVELHRKATGYGIVRFHKAARTITLEVWPRYVDPTDPRTGGPYPGWPITVHQADNYGRRAAAWLPVLQVTGMVDPVVQVIDEADGEVVYALRIKGTEFRPKVFREGTYTVVVGEPGTARVKTLKNVSTLPPGREQTLRVELSPV
jgi:hypothetical protein